MIPMFTGGLQSRKQGDNSPCLGHGTRCTICFSSSQKDELLPSHPRCCSQPVPFPAQPFPSTEQDSKRARCCLSPDCYSSSHRKSLTSIIQPQQQPAAITLTSLGTKPFPVIPLPSASLNSSKATLLYNSLPTRIRTAAKGTQGRCGSWLTGRRKPKAWEEGRGKEEEGACE